MCLTNVDKVLSGRGNKVYTGWKIFDIRPGGMEFECKSYKGNYRVPLNRWLIEERPLPNQAPEYPLGFHIFTTKEAALEWSNTWANGVRQVWYKGILARGRQGDHNKIIVAKSLYVRGRRKRSEAPQ